MSDPAAALTVARCGIPITWVTLDVTMRAPLRAAARGLLPAHHPLGAALGRMIDAWHAFWFPTALPPPDDPSPGSRRCRCHLARSARARIALRGRVVAIAPGPACLWIEYGVFHLHEQPDGAPGWLVAEVDGERVQTFLVARIVRHISGLQASAAPSAIF